MSDGRNGTAQGHVIEGEIIEPGTDLAVRPATSPTLFGTDDPAEVVTRATSTAQPLAKAVRDKKLSVQISGKEHVRVEGWTLLGAMLGVFPICVWTRKLEDGWEARVEARTIGGQVVGAAEAECLRSERTWKGRDDYALRSMAQTRATSKALRQPLGFVMQLAGFDPTPAEEMPREQRQRTAQPAQPSSEDDGLFPPADQPQPGGDAPKLATAAQKRKLNVLVGKLRDANHDPTSWMYQATDHPAIVGEDGMLHWSPLRDTIDRAEANFLIDKLEEFAARIEQPRFEIPEAARAELAARET